MSNLSKEEKEIKDSQVLVQKFISGEEKPDVVQAFNIIDSTIKNVMGTDVLKSGDIILAVRALDSLREYIKKSQ